MKVLRTFLSAGPSVVLFLFFAAPAFAQFEVNPDHFDNQPATTVQKPVKSAKKTAPVNASSQVAANSSSAKTAATLKTASTHHRKQAGTNAPAKKAGTMSASSKVGKPSAKVAQPTLKAQSAPVPRE